MIFLYMTGGVSHVDSFDPKPRLFAGADKTVRVDNFQGKLGDFMMYLKSPQFAFRPGGACGTEVSDLFPHVRSVVDDLCVIRSMSSDHTNHYEGTLGMHTGSFTFARPSLGAWVSYGLGTENRNLPSFVAVAPHVPYAGTQTWGSDFLPGCHQGTHIVPGPTPIANVRRRSGPTRSSSSSSNGSPTPIAGTSSSRQADAALEARIRSFETAYGMQREAPEVFDLSGESDATLALYGLERGRTDGFAWQCLVGRRLAERGVRFIELIDSGSSNNWDCARQHDGARPHGPERRPAHRRADRRPEVAGPARRHARRLDHRVRPDAVQRPAGRRRPRAPPSVLLVLAGRRRREERDRPRQRPTSTASRSPRTASTSTTSTPRSCTCSASTTPD